ncbi:MAG: hypothetical protein ACRDYC_12795 [Acidimicrobiales bacterium]
MKKGRHRRFEEARALKHSFEGAPEPCPECNAVPGAEHASWCLATEDDDELDAPDAGAPDTGAGYATS